MKEYKSRSKIVKAVRFSLTDKEALTEWTKLPIKLTYSGNVLLETFDGYVPLYEGVFIVEHPNGTFERMFADEFEAEFEEM